MKEKENVLSFSLEFLLRFNKLNNQSNINKLRVLIDGANIKINNKVKESIDINRLMDNSNPKKTLENSVKELHPRTDEQNLRYYLFWHEAEDPDLYMQQNGIAITDVQGFSKFHRKFCIGNQIYFSNNNEDNHISSWNDSIIKYLFTTKKMIVYDPYCLNSQEIVESNIIPFLNSISYNQKGIEKTVIIITSNKKNYEKRLGIDHFIQQNEIIKNAVFGINLIIFIKGGELPSNNRFILTDYFFISATHSLQAFKKKGGLKKNHDRMNFDALLDDANKESYYSFIGDIKKLIKRFNNEPNRIKGENYIELPYNKDGILSNNGIQSKEEILNLLDTF